MFYRSYANWEPAWDGWNMLGVVHSSIKHLWAATVWGSTAQQQTGPFSRPTFPPQRFPCWTEICEQVHDGIEQCHLVIFPSPMRLLVFLANFRSLPVGGNLHLVEAFPLLQEALGNTGSFVFHTFIHPPTLTQACFFASFGFQSNKHYQCTGLIVFDG